MKHLFKLIIILLVILLLMAIEQTINKPTGTMVDYEAEEARYNLMYR